MRSGIFQVPLNMAFVYIQSYTKEDNEFCSSGTPFLMSLIEIEVLLCARMMLRGRTNVISS